MPRVFSYLVSRSGGDRDLAEDLVQQTYLAAIQQRWRFDGRADPVTWLIGIARHKLADHYRALERAERRRIRLQVRDVGRPTTSTSQIVEERDAITEAFRSLPASQRAMLAFVAQDGLSVAEAGRLLGKSTSAAQSLLHRAREEVAVMTVLPDDRIGTAIIDPSGTVLRVLEIPDPTLNAVCTVWSADDARLACEAWDESDASRAGIYAVNAADGGDLERLTTPPSGLSDLPGDFAPDGSFVFKRYSGDEGPGPLMVLPAGGGEPEMLADGGFEDPGQFAPDGRLVATSIDGNIRIVNGDGQTVSEITGGYSFGPAWAPDGEWIVFARAKSGPFADLMVARPDGSDLRPVTATPENEMTVDWGP